ncbi:MAG: metallophosphoesterase [Flavobacteriaceae bacterium]|jgi:predicted MPP superfamily phosphohydrolase|nr:metallophosphoesterase [Flavobacteriaceae bacterium]
MVRLIIFLILVLALDFYALQSFRSVVRNPWITYGYAFISLAILGYIVFQVMTFERGSGDNSGFYLAFSLFVLVYVPKLVLVVFMFGEDVYRVFEAAVNYFVSKSENSTLFSSRRKFIGQLALGIAAIPFISILYGITKGKYNFKVLKYTLHFDDLPAAFDGYQISQISDIHSGSFDNKEKIEYAVDLVNKQASDVIMFTGDLVNSASKEMRPWKSTFSKLKAPDGVFSILGNHDYGDYSRWPSEEAKAENFQELLDIQKEMGFDLLRNESRFIEKEDARLAIIGVENWGKGFKQKGDLALASSKVDTNDFKILLSHDPSHWQYEVVKDPNQYHLTLSGHTHGMQFGIEIPGVVKWSPIKWRYKYWAGIYEKAGQYINVNRGFGFLAFPGRVGIWPEISVITLKKQTKIT